MKDLSKIDVDRLKSSKDRFLIVDVRSPKEFREDHILGSINMPILDDEQRHIIGYTYKQVDKEKALQMGYDILDKKIEDYIKNLRDKEKEIVIMCARGGMRSASVTELLQKKGLLVHQLEGGYKEYRRDLKENLEGFDYSKKKIYVLYGLTGTNKTEIIKGLNQSIDLEGIANHRGSVFGCVGLRPNTQKMFDTLLYEKLSDSEEIIVLEGESNKIGDVHLPKELFNQMKKASLIMIRMSVEQRIKNIKQDYFDTEEKAKEVKKILPQLVKKIGKKRMEELNNLLDNKEYDKFVRLMLEDYYDPLYKNTVEKKEYDLIIETDDTKEAIEKIKRFLKKN